MDRADYEAILEQELRALKQELSAYPGGTFGKELKRCYDIASQPLFAPKTYPEILEEFSEIRCEVTETSISSLKNIIIVRAALVLPQLLENARKALPQFYEYVKFQNEREQTKSIVSVGTTAKFLGWIKEHRRPLDLLVNKAVRLQGDPFEEAIEFLRNLELNLKRFQKDGSFANATLSEGTFVEEALQRIRRDIPRTKNTQARREYLAEKCKLLKLVYPDASDQIDKLFRKEVESLDEL